MGLPSAALAAVRGIRKQAVRCPGCRRLRALGMIERCYFKFSAEGWLRYSRLALIGCRPSGFSTLALALGPTSIREQLDSRLGGLASLEGDLHRQGADSKRF